MAWKLRAAESDGFVACDAGALPAPACYAAVMNKRQVKYKLIRESMWSWKTNADSAAAFATELGPDRLIGITSDDSAGITIWYWADVGPEGALSEPRGGETAG